MKATPIALVVTGLLTAPALADTLYDNGPPNGDNGYSNATEGVFGARRTLLDDFVVGHFFAIQAIHWEHIWNSFPPGSGGGLEISFRSDAGGQPGLTIATPEIFDYFELGSGVTYFGRPGAESWVRFREPVFLETGTYWFEATIVGPKHSENNFWLTIGDGVFNNNPCWVNYDDLGGLQPGRDIFGVDSDLNFVLEGGFPTPGALPLLVLAGVAAGYRCRSTGFRCGPAGGSAHGNQP